MEGNAGGSVFKTAVEGKGDQEKYEDGLQKKEGKKKKQTLTHSEL